jgi:hypothetical protein
MANGSGGEAVRRDADHALGKAREDAWMADLVSMSEREYFAYIAKRPGMFTGGSASLTRLEAPISGSYRVPSRRGTDHGGWTV